MPGFVHSGIVFLGLSVMKTKLFLNLTNGIEAIQEYNLKIEDISFVRIQSSYFEAHKYDEVIYELDHNLLMYLALGYECVIYDYGARADTAKALRIGIEWIRFVLCRRWFGTDYTPVIKHKIVSNYFNKKYSELSQKTKKKLDYYKKMCICDSISLHGINGNTLMDNKPEFYRQILVKYFSQKAL